MIFKYRLYCTKILNFKMLWTVRHKRSLTLSGEYFLHFYCRHCLLSIAFLLLPLCQGLHLKQLIDNAMLNVTLSNSLLSYQIVNIKFPLAKTKTKTFHTALYWYILEIRIFSSLHLHQRSYTNRWQKIMRKLKSSSCFKFINLCW